MNGLGRREKQPKKIGRREKKEVKNREIRNLTARSSPLSVTGSWAWGLVAALQWFPAKGALFSSRGLVVHSGGPLDIHHIHEAVK